MASASQRSKVGRLSGYFPGGVDDDVDARNFASGRASRIFAHHVEERLLVRVDRNLDHNKALGMRRRAGIQDTEDQGTVDALGLNRVEAVDQRVILRSAHDLGLPDWQPLSSW